MAESLKLVQRVVCWSLFPNPGQMTAKTFRDVVEYCADAHQPFLLFLGLLGLVLFLTVTVKRSLDK
jgi:hypothetical protein